MNQDSSQIEILGKASLCALQAIKGCILDMDGVIYRGNTLIPEARMFLETLDNLGIAWAMATNNSTASPQQYVEKLARMGISALPERIVTSGVATAAYLRARYPRGTTICVVGMDALRHALFDDGYFVSAERDASVVVSGADFDLRYDDLRIACLAIRNGAAYVATNGDTSFPSEDGLIPGAGAIVAALVAATDAEPVVVGKPSPEMLRSCLDILGTSAHETLMIGDRLDTDIMAGKRAEMPSLLVLTGVSSKDDIRTSGIQPDFVTASLTHVSELLNARQSGASR